MKRLIIWATLAILFAFMPAQRHASAKDKLAITITVVPPWDPGGPEEMSTIAGKVTGDCKQCKVILYSHGDIWYVQPYKNETATSIEPDGTWTNEIHLGTDYAALLTRSDYVPLSQTGTLPAGRAILASAVKPGRRQ
jgi:hypothetical protein